MVDWFEYKSPATRVDDWLLLLANKFSSSRIGEYIESSCRSGSGRGLYYRVSYSYLRGQIEQRRMLTLAIQDITFGVLVNEYGNPEFAVQLTRDAKKKPQRRPRKGSSGTVHRAVSGRRVLISNM